MEERSNMTGGNGMRAATSSDVARYAKVSQSTVSRAFNETSRLSAATRKRVLDAARTLGYRPNAIARSLVSNRTNIIALIVMRNGSPFYNHLVDGMVTVCRSYGYCTMMIRQLEGEKGTETVSRALEYRVDGVVITAIEDSESACEICRQSSVPIVLLNRYIERAGVDSVCCDNFLSGQMIAEFLAEKKQKQIACLMGDQNASTTRDRLRGILSRSGELGLRIDQVEYGQYTYESGSEMCRKLLKECGTLPQAIFCSGDIIAFGAMDVLRYEANLRIPEDISVIGFDDTVEAAWKSYNLTTVRQPYSELVNTACQLLIRRMDAPNESVVRALHACRLIERGTVKNG